MNKISSNPQPPPPKDSVQADDAQVSSAIVFAQNLLQLRSGSAAKRELRWQHACSFPNARRAPSARWARSQLRPAPAWRFRACRRSVRVCPGKKHGAGSNSQQLPSTLNDTFFCLQVVIVHVWNPLCKCEAACLPLWNKRLPTALSLWRKRGHLWPQWLRSSNPMQSHVATLLVLTFRKEP